MSLHPVAWLLVHARSLCSGKSNWLQSKSNSEVAITRQHDGRSKFPNDGIYYCKNKSFSSPRAHGRLVAVDPQGIAAMPAVGCPIWMPHSDARRRMPQRDALRHDSTPGESAASMMGSLDIRLQTPESFTSCSTGRRCSLLLPLFGAGNRVVGG